MLSLNKSEKVLRMLKLINLKLEALTKELVYLKFFLKVTNVWANMFGTMY